jgi:hypothetical protein
MKLTCCQCSRIIFSVTVTPRNPDWFESERPAVSVTEQFIDSTHKHQFLEKML